MYCITTAILGGLDPLDFPRIYLNSSTSVTTVTHN